MLEYDGRDGQGYTRIDSVEELRQVLEGGMQEFKLLLNGGVFSRKEIQLKQDGRFQIFNYIDDSERTVTAEELGDPTKTMIGEAISKGAFWMYGKHSENETDELIQASSLRKGWPTS